MQYGIFRDERMRELQRMLWGKRESEGETEVRRRTFWKLLERSCLTLHTPSIL